MPFCSPFLIPNKYQFNGTLYKTDTLSHFIWLVLFTLVCVLFHYRVDKIGEVYFEKWFFFSLYLKFRTALKCSSQTENKCLFVIFESFSFQFRLSFDIYIKTLTTIYTLYSGFLSDDLTGRLAACLIDYPDSSARLSNQIN